MPRLRRSQALRDFRQSMTVAEALIKKEQNYKDPAPPQFHKVVQGLRGGAIVIMVAAFESYLTTAAKEYLYDLTQYPIRFNPTKIPEVMVYKSCMLALEKSIKDPYTPPNPPLADKITRYRSAADIVVKGLIDSSVFSDMAKNNPNPKKIETLFKSLGVPNIFQTIKPDFDTRWGSPTSMTFIQDRLQTLINLRHEVAHKALTLNISRRDLQEFPKFIKILAELCDETLNRHIKQITR